MRKPRQWHYNTVEGRNACKICGQSFGYETPSNLGDYAIPSICPDCKSDPETMKRYYAEYRRLYRKRKAQSE